MRLLIVGFLLASFTAAGQQIAEIREFDVPTPGSRPHDPAVAPDGALWYTGQAANKLGRLDPKSGKIREFALPVADSGPHGLVADARGNIWFTANHKGYVGRLDPKSGKVQQYRMPEPAARDPHTPVFDRDGRLWFTLQQANMVGRLDPRSGKVELKPVPTPSARPYGIVLAPDGVLWFCEFGTNKLASVEPVTFTLQEHTLPAGARPRRLAAAADGTIYYSDFARGYLGHLDPKSGKVEEWPSPGGAGSRPYGIAITPEGTVWFSESGVEPNTLVRFDPATKQFATMPIPGGGGVVRHMVATRDGKLFLTESGVNKVAIATPATPKP